MGGETLRRASKDLTCPNKFLRGKKLSFGGCGCRRRER